MKTIKMNTMKMIGSLRKFHRNIGALFLLLLSMNLIGACQVREVQPKINELQTDPLQDFDVRPSSGTHQVNFTSNRFFLWKDSFTSFQVSEAIRIGKELDQLDDERFDLGTRVRDVERRLAELNRQKIEIRSRLQQLEVELHDREIRGTGTRSVDVIRADLERTRELLSNSETEVLGVSDELNLVRANKIRREIEIDDAVPAVVDQLMQTVDFFDTPPGIVSLEFHSDGKVDVTMMGWDTRSGEGERDFSSRTNSGMLPIKDVKYVSRGGILSFEVQTGAQEAYRFHVARTRIRDRYQRIFYEGTLTQVLNGVERMGAVKICDKNNLE